MQTICELAPDVRVYLLTFNGLRLAITGDTIQSRDEPGGLEFIIANHSVPDERTGLPAPIDPQRRSECRLRSARLIT